MIPGEYREAISLRRVFTRSRGVESDEILRTQLDRVHAECERLRKENADLRLRLGEAPEDSRSIVAAAFLHSIKSEAQSTVYRNG